MGNKKINNYLWTRMRIRHIESILGGDSEMCYTLKKIISTLLYEGFEAEEIRDYMIIKLYEEIDKLKKENK